MRNVYTFAGLTFALALAFSLTTAAQTSSTESKQKASPDLLEPPENPPSPDSTRAGTILANAGTPATRFRRRRAAVRVT
jgi:hypothetical protein